MRYLGVDLGTKRIGLAIGDDEQRIASPLEVIDARPKVEDNARAILEVADAYGATAIVIGLPLNMDDTEGPQTKPSKTLAAAIQAIRAGERVAVYLYDERLTSHAADQLLTGQDLTHKKKKARHDAMAAQVLLQSFLDNRQTSK